MVRSMEAWSGDLRKKELLRIRSDHYFRTNRRQGQAPARRFRLRWLRFTSAIACARGRGFVSNVSASDQLASTPVNSGQLASTRPWLRFAPFSPLPPGEGRVRGPSEEWWLRFEHSVTACATQPTRARSHSRRKSQE